MLSFAVAGLANTDGEKQFRYRLKEGPAEKTLKSAAMHGGIEIVYTKSMVKDVQTRPVEGLYYPGEALKLMLEDTSLAVVRVSEEGIYTIKIKETDPGGNRDRSQTELNKQSDLHNQTMKLPETEKNSTLKKTLRSMIAALGATGAIGASAQDETRDEETVYELSPFTVDGSEDQGYTAESTIAGTRIKTNLADVGASITAVTESFIKDTGVTNLNELLLYTANTESAGVDGSYTAGINSFAEVGSQQTDGQSQAFQSGVATIENPQGAQRIRGLFRADVTRNLFRTDIPIDAYNIDRVEIVRGANSILFGQGSPSGIINSNLKLPFFEDAHEISIRFDSNGSLRGSFDSNLVLADDRLAVRVAGLKDDFKFRQKPAFDNDERLYGALRWRINENLSFKANGEVGAIRANRANQTAPIDGVSFYLDQVGLATYPFFNPGEPRIPEIFGRTNLLPASVPAIGVQYAININHDGSFAVDPSLDGAPSQNSARFVLAAASIKADNAAGIPRRTGILRYSDPVFRFASGFGKIPESLSDYTIFDWKNKYLPGNFGYQNQDFQTFQGALEYTTSDGRFGAELSFDHQYGRSNIQQGPTSGRDYMIRLDVSQQTFDQSPNANVLRPILPLSQYIDQGTESETSNSAVQINAFARFDFQKDAGLDGWLGNLLGSHTLTLNGSETERELERVRLDTTFTGGNLARNAFHPLDANIPFGSNFRDATAIVYLGPALTSPNPQDLQISQLTFSSAEFFPNGSTYPMRIWDKDSQDYQTFNLTAVHKVDGALYDKQSVESIATTLQSRLLNDHVIVTMGYRDDSNKKEDRVYPSPPGVANTVDPNLFDTVLESGDGEYFSYGVVAHAPRGWALPLETRLSVFYSESENFDPGALGRVTPLGVPLGPPTGETKDYGIRVNTFNGKLNLKVGFFETALAGQSFTGGILAPIMNYDFNFRLNTVNRLLVDGYIPENHSLLSNHGEPPAATRTQLGAIINDQGSYEFNTSFGSVLYDTTDSNAEGVEIEAIFNPTRNWRMLFNIARQETVQQNSVSGLKAYVAERLPSWETVFDYPRGGLGVNQAQDADIFDSNGYIIPSVFAEKYPNNTRQAQYDEWVRIPLQKIIDEDGGVAQEQREWRANVVTNYTFDRDSKLVGFNIGGAYRWQDRAAIGYPRTTNEDGQVIIDVDNPYFGEREGNVDVWVGYSRKFYNDEVDWKIQLNVRNAFSDDDPILVTRDAFGIAGQYRLPALTYWTVTNTFKF